MVGEQLYGMARCPATPFLANRQPPYKRNDRLHGACQPHQGGYSDETRRNAVACHKPRGIMRFATIQTWAGPRAALRRGDVYVDLHATDANVPPNMRMILE